MLLVARQRDPGRADAVLLRRPENQSPPTAADIEKLLTRLEHELATDVVELLGLCRVERIAIALEVGAGVHHPLVEPHAIERVGDIVVVLDVLGVAALLVHPLAYPRAGAVAA